MGNEIFIVYLVFGIIGFMFMIYFGLIFTSSIKDKNMYYMGWIIYIAFSLVLINVFMTAIFYSILQNKTGPPGKRGLTGIKGNRGDIGFCDEDCRTNEMYKDIQTLLQEKGIVNKQFINKLKQIVDSANFQILISIRTPIVVKEYFINKFRVWIEYIERVGDSDNDKPVLKDNNANYLTERVRNELELYDIYWFNDNDTNSNRFNKFKKNLEIRVCSDYEKTGFYTKQKREHEPSFNIIETNNFHWKWHNKIHDLQEKYYYSNRSIEIYRPLGAIFRDKLYYPLGDIMCLSRDGSNVMSNRNDIFENNDIKFDFTNARKNPTSHGNMKSTTYKLLDYPDVNINNINTNYTRVTLYFKRNKTIVITGDADIRMSSIIYNSGLKKNDLIGNRENFNQYSPEDSKLWFPTHIRIDDTGQAKVYITTTDVPYDCTESNSYRFTEKNIRKPIIWDNLVSNGKKMFKFPTNNHGSNELRNFVFGNYSIRVMRKDSKHYLPRCPSLKNRGITTKLISVKRNQQGTELIKSPRNYKRHYYSHKLGMEICNNTRLTYVNDKRQQQRDDDELKWWEAGLAVATMGRSLLVKKGLEETGIIDDGSINWNNYRASPPRINNIRPHTSSNCESKPFLEDVFMHINQREGMLKPIMVWRPIPPTNYRAFGDIYGYWDNAETIDLPTKKIMKPRTGKMAPIVCVHKNIVFPSQKDKLWGTKSTSSSASDYIGVGDNSDDTDFYKHRVTYGADNFFKVHNKKNGDPSPRFYSLNNRANNSSYNILYNNTNASDYITKTDNDSLNEHINNTFSSELRDKLTPNNNATNEERRLFNLTTKWYGNPEKNRHWDKNDLEKYSILDFIGVIREGIITHKESNMNFWIVHNNGYYPQHNEDNINNFYNSFNIIDTHKRKYLKYNTNDNSITFEDAFDSTDGKLKRIHSNIGFNFSIDLTSNDVSEDKGNFRIIPIDDIDNKGAKRYLEVSGPTSDNIYAGELEGHFRYSLKSGNRDQNNKIFTNFISPYGDNLYKLFPEIEGTENEMYNNRNSIAREKLKRTEGGERHGRLIKSLYDSNLLYNSISIDNNPPKWNTDNGDIETQVFYNAEDCDSHLPKSDDDNDFIDDVGDEISSWF